MQPNRLDRNWPAVARELKRKYPSVSDALWDSVCGEYDKIVRVVRDSYCMGRSEITVEAEVRDLLNNVCDEAESF